MKIDGISIKGWRSFDEVGATLNHLRKVNLIIGPNNVGKSNLSRLLKRLKEMTANLIEGERRRQPSNFMTDMNLSHSSGNFIQDDDMWKWLNNEIMIEIFPSKEIAQWSENSNFSWHRSEKKILSIKSTIYKNKADFTICGDSRVINIAKPNNTLPTSQEREYSENTFKDATSFINKFWVELIDSLVFIDPIRHYSRPHKPNENVPLTDFPKFYFNGADLMVELINLHKQDRKSWGAYKKQMEKWLKDIVDDSICNIALAEPDQYRLHFKLDEREIIQNLDELGTGVAQVVMLLSFLYLSYLLQSI